MLIQHNESKCLDNTFIEVSLQVINHIVNVNECAFIHFMQEDIVNEEGVVVSGAYMRFDVEDTYFHIIFIADTDDEMKMLETLIHEYSHHLSQEHHYGKLFTLYYEHLTREVFKVMLTEEKIREKIEYYVTKLKDILAAETGNLFQNHMVELDRNVISLSMLYEVLELKPPVEVISLIEELKVKCQKL